MELNTPISDQAISKIQRGIEEGKCWLVYGNFSVSMNSRDVRQFQAKAAAIRAAAKANKPRKFRLVYASNIQDALRLIRFCN